MEQFALLLGVRDWTYSRQQCRDLKTGEYETHRSIVLRCFWNDGPGFLINGQPFREPINVSIRIGEPFQYSPPLELDFSGGPYLIHSGLGGARYFPKRVNSDTAEVVCAFIDIVIVVSFEVFTELLDMRHELKSLTLDAMGNNVKLDYDGEPSWDHAEAKDNALYVTGFYYSTAAA